MSARGKEAPPLVVIGSANADIYVEIARLPKEGETIVAKSGHTFPGGKGANQAACAARLSHPTYFIGQVGKDGYATLIHDAMETAGVRLDYLNKVEAPTGHAVVMLQPGGQNSIIVVAGANNCWPHPENGSKQLHVAVEQLIQRAGAVLLQREIPDSVNIEAARIARKENVPVIMDAGGTDAPFPEELLECITVLSPNETELARLTMMPTETTEQVILAADKCLEMGVEEVLVKLGEHGSVLVRRGRPPIFQAAILAPVVIDTTGAGDTFTAAFAVALVEGKVPADALQFATASLCVRSKGAIPSMPDKRAVKHLLEGALSDTR
ncbi:hypothetical protein O6H91_16G033900 [Diphasiastrum complanatum]|uniref:Uncharacterized protein n=1 Tax=Diphasiastrum complanatum TaxID=34168 RepID=A0ACC2BBD3_DIPCM|nr:hypothetical protein O6H91_16G033900 [Diphasiastrum complanatum]